MINVEKSRRFEKKTVMETAGVFYVQPVFVSLELAVVRLGIN